MLLGVWVNENPRCYCVWAVLKLWFLRKFLRSLKQMMQINPMLNYVLLWFWLATSKYLVMYCIWAYVCYTVYVCTVWSSLCVCLCVESMNVHTCSPVNIATSQGPLMTDIITGWGVQQLRVWEEGLMENLQSFLNVFYLEFHGKMYRENILRKENGFKCILVGVVEGIILLLRIW